MKNSTKHPTLRFLSYMFFLVIGFSACEVKHAKHIMPNTASLQTMTPIVFPATDMEHFMYYADDDELNCPTQARLAATYEMLEGGYQLLESLRNRDVYAFGGQEYVIDDDYLYASWSLTEFPRVIFDFNGRAKYYEYGLIEDNVITATITVYARREAPCAIAYIFPYVLPYNFSNYNYYVGEYPQRVYYDGTGYRYVDDVNTEYGYFEDDMDSYWAQIEAQATSEEMEEIYALQQAMNTPNIALEEETAEFWSDVNYAISLALPNGITVDDACVSPPTGTVYNNYIEHLKDVLGTSEYCRDYTATPYCGEEIQRTHWHLGCGPAALSWVYRGLYNTYPPYIGTYLPIHGDPYSTYFQETNYGNNSVYEYELDSLDTWSELMYAQVKNAYINRSQIADNGLAANFLEKCFAVKYQGEWNFALIVTLLDDALNAATDDAFGVKDACGPLAAADWIDIHNLPVLINMDNFYSHYLVAYGYGGISDTWGGNISQKNLYFLITDNGFLIKHNYYDPYWRRNIMGEAYYRIKHNI